jgi:hypothetical protein
MTTYTEPDRTEGGGAETSEELERLFAELRGEHAAQQAVQRPDPLSHHGRFQPKYTSAATICSPLNVRTSVFRPRPPSARVIS